MALKTERIIGSLEIRKFIFECSNNWYQINFIWLLLIVGANIGEKKAIFVLLEIRIICAESQAIIPFPGEYPNLVWMSFSNDWSLIFLQWSYFAFKSIQLIIKLKQTKNTK
jgi:hypothetical protein